MIVTGGFQHASIIAEAIRRGWCDGVTIARPLIANRWLPKILQRQNGPDAGRECTYCNKCLINDLQNPLGCYELSRYGGVDFEDIRQIRRQLLHDRCRCSEDLLNALTR